MRDAPLIVDGAPGVPASEPENRVFVADDFAGRTRAGEVIGSTSKSGVKRRGIDCERVIEIRDDALRIRPLVIPGWGRAGISYGPIERRSGLGVAIHVLNGENGAEAYELASVLRRLGRWALASETDSLWMRFLRWPFRPSGDSLLRKLCYWYASCHIEKAYRPMRENLAVGWFSADAPADATKSTDAFVVRGAGPLNGELNVCVGDTLMPVINSLPNVPIYYFVLLRETGSAYYIASHDLVAGTAGFPTMRPIAINPTSTAKSLYPGMHQSIVGESGFSAETVLYRIHVASYAGLGRWYGTAHAADRLTGEGKLAGSTSETGAAWRVVAGNPERSQDGSRGANEFSMACLVPDQSTGLVHAVVELPAGSGKAGIVWRVADSRNYHCLSISRNRCELAIVAEGERQLAQSCALTEDDGRHPLTVQIRDDGSEIAAAINGRPIVESARSAETRSTGRGVGIFFEPDDNAAPLIRDFEAHPRLVDLSAELPFALPWSRSGDVQVISDDFGSQRGDLAGYGSPGGAVWSRIMGDCRFELTGDQGVRIAATRQQPTANRTAYGFDWPEPNFADVSTVIVPPGQERGQNHAARGGLVFWQDEKNYFIINNWLDDSYGGGSISAFFYFRGFEDIYDAVWTNVNDRLAYGQPNRLRLVCDGTQFRVHLNDVPVLYRAFRDVYPRLGRFHIRKVGLVSNWEWGRDTGSRFLSIEGYATAGPGSGTAPKRAACAGYAQA